MNTETGSPYGGREDNVAETQTPSPAAGANEVRVRWDKCKCGMTVGVPENGHVICWKCGRRNSW